MWTRNFLKNQSGSMAPLFGLAIVGVVGVAGASIDYSQAARIRSGLQEATDAAALAAARRPVNERVQLATAFVGANFQANTQAGSFTPTVRVTNNADGSVTVTATGRVPAAFLPIIGTNGLDVGAASTAIAQTSTGSPCFLMLDPSADGGLRINSVARVDARDCEVHVHSNHSNSAFIFNSGARFDATRFCVRGGAINRGSTTGRVETGCTPSPDPYAGNLPAVGSTACTFTNMVFNPATTINISPGVYCGNTIFNGSPKIVMQPGLYVLRGPFILNSGSELQGSNVSIALHGDQADIMMNGQITLDLMAPNNGTYKDWLIWQTAPQSRRNFIFNTEVAQSLQGIVYLPNKDVTFNSTTRTGRRDKLSVVTNTLIVNAQAGWRVDPLGNQTPTATAGTPRLIR